jgi:hypothetical protein
MAEIPIAKNDKGDVLGFDGKAWRPPDEIAQNDAGRKAFRFGNTWQIDPMAEPTSALGTPGVTLGSIGASFNEGLAQTIDIIPQMGNWILRQFDSKYPKLGSDPSGVRTGLKSLGIPVGDLETQKREYGVELGPVRRIGGTAAKILGQSTPLLPIGPIGPSLRAAGAAATLGSAGREAGEALGGERGGQIGETTGSLIGGVGLPIAEILRRQGAGRAASAASAPKIADVKAEAIRDFDAFKTADAAVTKQSFNDLAQSIHGRLTKEVIVDPALHPKTIAIYNKIFERANNPNVQGVTTGDIWGIRRTINKVIARADPDDARLLKAMKGDLDSYVANLKPTDALWGDVAGASVSLRQGIEKYSRAAAAQEIDDIIQAARARSGQYVGPNLDKALRTEFSKIARNPDELRRFVPEGRAAIQEFVKGGPLRNILKFVGKFSPSGVIPAMGHGALSASNPVVGIPLALTTMAARTGANRMAVKGANKITDIMLRGGQPAPVAPVNWRDLLLLNSAAAQAGRAYSSRD